jgi:glycosyltransferase involved in cell wall biosynthesis
MTKIAFIVEPEFLERHWGVRVYLYSLAKMLKRHRWTVDFVMPQMSIAGDVRWTKIDVRDESLFSSAGPSAAGSPAEVWAALRDVAFKETPKTPTTAPAPKPPSAGVRRPAVMPLGSSLASENYAAALITNPWMVKWQNRLPVAHVMGLVLDLIPNLFGVLLDEGKPFVFAHQHQRGFKYYEEHCDTVLAISESTRQAYLDLVRSRRAGAGGPDVVGLPPFAPYDQLDEPTKACHPTRASRIALAACFDPRKGLRELPALLNGLADVVEEVVVYGGVRCRKAEAEAFFSSLEIERIVWHLGATASQVRDLFRRSSFLLFPSRFEGLGLPLLEAQLEGCRVATYPESPMKELALSGGVMLADSPDESVARLRRALAETFDHARLRSEARAAFVEPVLRSNPLEQVLTRGQSASSDAMQRLVLSR